MGIFHLFFFQLILINVHSAAKTLIDVFNGKQYYIPWYFLHPVSLSAG